MATAKRSLSLGLSTLVIVMLAMLMAVPARADDVTFFDSSTDIITASTTGSRITIGPCGFTEPDPLGSGVMVEACVARVSAPSGSISGGPALAAVGIGEADGTLSDQILEEVSTATGTIAFLSDLSDPSQGGIPVTCGAGGCAITEDWTVQFGGSISWMDPLTGAVIATDNIKFQSDLDAPVPEPASLTLLGSGLLAIAGYIRRRLA